MKRFRRTGLATIIATLLILIAGSPVATACPNCMEAVSLQDGDAARQAGGYNWSVMFMIAVPFSMMGTGAFAIRRAVKRGVFPEL